MKIICVF